MKYIFLIGLVFSGMLACAQVDTTSPPYKRFPSLPPIQILLSDSTTIYTKAQLPHNKPVLFMLFDPGCSHCQHETEQLVSHSKELNGIQVVMVALPNVSFAQIDEFISRYRVRELKNVVLGKDMYYFMPSFYMISNFPFLALYNKEGNLVSAFEGGVEPSKLVKMLKD